MLTVDWSTIRLFLHVLAATVWVGGQLTLLGLVPTLRGLSPDGPRLAARRFNVLAWSAFARPARHRHLEPAGRAGRDPHHRLAGHARAEAPAGRRLGHRRRVPRRRPVKVVLAVGGAVALLGGIGAVFLGIQLAGVT